MQICFFTEFPLTHCPHLPVNNDETAKENRCASSIMKLNKVSRQSVNFPLITILHNSLLSTSSRSEWQVCRPLNGLRFWRINIDSWQVEFDVINSLWSYERFIFCYKAQTKSILVGKVSTFRMRPINFSTNG